MATPNVLETRAGSGPWCPTQISMATADRPMDAPIRTIQHTPSVVDGTAGGTVAIAPQGTVDVPNINWWYNLLL